MIYIDYLRNKQYSFDPNAIHSEIIVTYDAYVDNKSELLLNTASHDY